MAALRDLTTLEEFRAVERLESEIWGPIDLVPVPILAVTIQRGAVLVGAFAGDRLIGFVYSFPALKPEEPKPSHWSHMLGVHPDHRGSGLGRELKLAQRDRVLALGLDLVEWTYDPLQATNAHLNFVTLGTVVEEYAAERIRRVDEPIARGHRDRSFHLPVVDPQAARRAANPRRRSPRGLARGGGRARRESRQGRRELAGA